MGFQTKGLRLPLRRALITAKDTTSPPKVCLPALSCAVAIFIAVFSRYRQLVLLCFHISPVQYPHCLVPSRLSLHVCLNSSREFPPSPPTSPCSPTHCVTPQSPLTRVCARKSASTLAYQRVFAPG